MGFVPCALSARCGEGNTGTKESLDEATNAGRGEVTIFLFATSDGENKGHENERMGWALEEGTAKWLLKAKRTKSTMT